MHPSVQMEKKIYRHNVFLEEKKKEFCVNNLQMESCQSFPNFKKKFCVQIISLEPVY